MQEASIVLRVNAERPLRSLFAFWEPLMAEKFTKESVRKWQQKRVRERKPLPDQKTIRRELGIDLVDAQRNKARKIWRYSICIKMQKMADWSLTNLFRRMLLGLLNHACSGPGWQRKGSLAIHFHRFRNIFWTVKKSLTDEASRRIRIFEKL